MTLVRVVSKSYKPRKHTVASGGASKRFRQVFHCGLPTLFQGVNVTRI